MKPAPQHAPSADLIDLRERAQERMREQRNGNAAPAAAHKVAETARLADNPRRLLHELEVYQVELELQNEQLEAARAWIEAALASYTELYDYAPVPYLSLSRLGVIVETNLAGARLVGIERARMLDKRLERFIVETDRHRVAACLKTVFTTAVDALCEVALVTSDGGRRTVEMRAALANNGDTCRVVLIDVSERSAHARHMARLGDVFSHAREAMCISDNDGIVVDVNQAFTEMSGYARVQVVGQPARMLRCDGDANSGGEAPTRDATVARALATAGSWRGVARHRHRDGATYLVLEDISTLRDSWGAQLQVARFLRHDGDADAGTPLRP